MDRLWGFDIVARFVKDTHGFDMESGHYSIVNHTSGKDGLLAQDWTVSASAWAEQHKFFLKVTDNIGDQLIKTLFADHRKDLRTNLAIPEIYDLGVKENLYYYIYEKLSGPIDNLTDTNIDQIAETLLELYKLECEPWEGQSLGVESKSIDNFYNTFRDSNSPYLRDIFENLSFIEENLDEMNRSIEKVPLVLSHGDLKYEHLYMRKNQDAVLIDWGSIRPNYVGADFYLLEFDSRENEDKRRAYSKLFDRMLELLPSVPRLALVTRQTMDFSCFYFSLKKNLEWSILFPQDDEFRRRLLATARWLNKNFV